MGMHTRLCRNVCAERTSSKLCVCVWGGGGRAYAYGFVSGSVCWKEEEGGGACVPLAACQQDRSLCTNWVHTAFQCFRPSDRVESMVGLKGLACIYGASRVVSRFRTPPSSVPLSNPTNPSDSLTVHPLRQLCAVPSGEASQREVGQTSGTAWVT